MAVVSEIKALAETLGYTFFYGTAEYVNFELTRHSATEGLTTDVMALVRITNTGSYLNSIINTTIYNSILMLGRKVDYNEEGEPTTYANLDETFYQKHERRLEDMENDMLGFITTLGCEDKFTILSHRIFSEINRFDENIDVLMCEISFEYEH